MIHKRCTVVFLCIMMTCFQQVLCVFTFSEQKLNIRIDEKVSVDFVMRKPLNITGYDNVTVNFAIEDRNVVNVAPEFIKIGNDVLHDSYPVTIRGLKPGKSDISTEASSASSPSRSTLDGAFIVVNVYKSDVIVLISNIIGWLYFLAWSVSFYPQIWTNFKRKSVVGLNFDFVSLNIVGYVNYTVFNLGMFAIPKIREQYSNRYPESVIPVLINDIVFAVHGTMSTVVTGIQCLIYEKRMQRISFVGKILHFSFGCVISFSIVASVFGVIEWLDFMYICSYVKLCVTVTKYVPQAYMNYSRKSTTGWNIYNVIGDLAGGILSTIQMFLNAYNYDEWEGLIENPTKFWLGVLTIVFDLIFMVQHYFLYRSDYKWRENMVDEEKPVMGSKAILLD